MLALAICAGQATARLELSQVHLCVAYTLLAVVACFFVDRYSGAVLAVVSLLIGLHILGVLSHEAKVYAGEFVLIAGLLFCAYSGPSGGIFSGPHTTFVSGRDNPLAVRATGLPAASKPVSPQE